jgi:hypothetical protein
MTVDDLRRKAILTSLIQKMVVHGSWCGETHVQKTVYFLSDVFSLDLDLDFLLYKHGPFSFDLRDTLADMKADNLVEIRIRRENYGPSLLPGNMAEDFIERYPKTLGKWEPVLEFVASNIGARSVAELERLATALYVWHQEGIDESDIPTRVHELKPHVSLVEAMEALHAVQELLDKAEMMGLPAWQYGISCGASNRGAVE